LKDDGFDNFGFMSVAVLYLFYGVFSLLSPAIVNKMGKMNIAMSTGAMCYSFWIVCFLLPSYYAQDTDEQKPWILNKNLIKSMIVLTAAINGIGAGILWTAQGKFISECACEENKGFFNSYFWAIFEGSMIFGNVIAVIVLEEGAEKSTLFTIFSIMAISAALMMLCLRIPKTPTLVQDRKMLNPSFTDSEKNQEVPTRFFLDGKEENPEARSSTELIRETCRLLKNKRMLHIVPFIIWGGCGASFMSGILVPLLVRTMKDPRSRHMHPDLVTDNDRSRQALLTLTALGTGEILGGMFLIGPIRDSCGNRPAYTC